MIAGERADQSVRELTAQHGLEPLTRPRARLAPARDAGTVVEQAGDGFAVGGRRCVHGTVVIGAALGRCDPWRE